jgi:membrane protein YqaA with SNARE-associated domain
MKLSAAHPAALATLLQQAARPHRPHSVLMHFLISFGVAGLFLVAIVDSSFVPLPIPGMTDIMIILFAARHTNPILLVAVATAGSSLGGFLSYQVGHAGGMAFIEKRIPPRLFKRVCDWIEHHAILAVSLPALLPPPMPLSPFPLAAGALKMRRRTFILAFTISRMIRHIVAAWLGIAFGRTVLRFWNQFSARWGNTILIVVWALIAISIGYAAWELWRTRNAIAAGIRPAATT